ncbi:hypothetical protein [Streptomyces sp. NBC_01358]|nr:hypothetical protein [Streptomyces sp. NBC_01358]
MTTSLHEIDTSESDDGGAHPVECIWTPGEDAVKNGVVIHRGLFIAGI